MTKLEKVSSICIAVTIPVCFIVGLILSHMTEPTGYKYACKGLDKHTGSEWTQSAAMPAATLENARKAAYNVGGTCVITKTEFK